MPSPEPRRAVVIEDDPDIRGLLVRILTKQGFEVAAAADGLAGVAAVRAAQPDLVTLDLNLPDLDGLEVCTKLREFSEAYIIMLTARVDELDKLTGLDSGADDYINKPFSPREFQSRVNALFRRARTPAADAAAQDNLIHAGRVQQSLLPTEKVQLDAAFSAASTSIAADLDGSGSFVTLFHARLDATSGRVGYVDAGHGLALHVGASGVALRLPSAGPPVGAWADTQWREAELDLNPGDALVVVSDGILDIFPSVEEFTAAVLRVTHTQPTADAVCDALLALAPAGTAEDDVTAVVVRRLAGNGPQPAAVETRSGAASL